MFKKSIDESPEAEIGLDDLDAKLKALENAERAIDDAERTGKADRAKITQSAQLDAAEAVAMVGIAMESDAEADEAMRISVIAERSGDRAKAKEARAREKAARKKANADHNAATKSARAAFNAIKFSAPNRMGFMRFVQVVFALHIAITLFTLILTSRDTIIYTSNTIITWIMVVLEGVAFWFFINRHKVGRPFVIGMSVFGVVAPLVYDLVTGTSSLVEQASDSAFFIFLILYFALSKRVKATLVNDFTQQSGFYEKADVVPSRKSWPFIRNCIMYFFIFSVVGHWMEVGMCQFIIMGLVDGSYDPTNTMLWRDWLYPFPMEGIAVVLIAVVLYPLLQKMKKTIKLPILPYVISFVLNGLFCGAIEFFSGLLVNANHELWDYSDNFCNIMGQVCLQNVLAFAAAASIITWFVYPLMEWGFARIRRDVMNVVFVVVLGIGAILYSLYIIDPPAAHQGYDVPVPETQVEKDYGKAYVPIDLITGSIGELKDMSNGESTLNWEEAKKDIAELESAINRLNDNLADQAVDAHEQAVADAYQKAADDLAEKEAEKAAWEAEHPDQVKKKDESAAADASEATETSEALEKAA